MTRLRTAAVDLLVDLFGLLAHAAARLARTIDRDLVSVFTVIDSPTGDLEDRLDDLADYVHDHVITRLEECETELGIVPLDSMSDEERAEVLADMLEDARETEAAAE